MQVNGYGYSSEGLTKVTSLEVGCTYLVSTIDAVSPVSNNTGSYPWGDRTVKVPVEVLSKNERFYLVKVLPHFAHCGSFGLSEPYTVSIDIWDLSHGRFNAWEYDYYKYEGR